VTVLEVLCTGDTTAGWFYNTTTGWVYSTTDYTPLLHLQVDTEDFWGYCVNYEVPVHTSDVFNASIYTAEPTCKNNSIHIE
jgi:hypothetical protein